MSNVDQEIVRDHQRLVLRLKKNPELIRMGLTPADVDLMHMALGLGGEAGEVVDLVKKIVINGHACDQDMQMKLLEEVGDVLFYLVGLLQEVGGFHIEDALRMNMVKLDTRYPKGYSDKASRERIDKVPKGSSE